MIRPLPLLTPSEAAMVATVPTRTILSAIRTGELAAFKFNARTFRIEQHDLQAWLARCRNSTQLDTTPNCGSAVQGLTLWT